MPAHEDIYGTVMTVLGHGFLEPWYSSSLFVVNFFFPFFLRHWGSCFKCAIAEFVREERAEGDAVELCVRSKPSQKDGDLRTFLCKGI